MASKHMNNCPPYPSCVATQNRHVIFLCVGDSEKMMHPTDDDEFQYSLKFQLLTDMSVMHLPDLTRGYQ